MKVTSWQNNHIRWTQLFSNSITTIELAKTIQGPWLPQESFYNSLEAAFPLSGATEDFFVRLLQVDVSGTPEGYTNLLESYGAITTVAGNGLGAEDNVNYWRDEFEGAPATEVSLSRPHIAMADQTGNIFIADKGSHSILKVTRDGQIHTIAGTHVSGFNGDGPAPALSLTLASPNGLFVPPDGSFLILDTDNSKVRRVGTNGIMTTLFTVNGGIDAGRGLWANADDSRVYFCSGTKLKVWTPTDGVSTLNDNFVELGNLAVDSTGHVFVTDRGDHFVYRISDGGKRKVVAGNGKKSGGGDGALATDTGLYGVRGICFLPNGGYLLATHEGSQVWYVDTSGIIHLFVDGQLAAHNGDGEYFHSPGFKISEPRQVTLTDQGELLIAESDNGYIRKIRFGRVTP